MFQGHRLFGEGVIIMLPQWIFMHIYEYDFASASEGKASACNDGDPGSIPGWGRLPGEGNGKPLQYSCLENPTDGGAW